MKKVIFVLVLVLIIGVDVVAQKDTVVVVGQKMDGTAMSVPALHFDKSVFTFNFSGDKTNLCVSYRNRSKNGKSWKIQGTISLFNFKERRELWHRPINYIEESAICTNKGVIVCTYVVNQHYNTFYSKIDGRKLWENAGLIIQVDDSHKSFYGYRNRLSDQLCAFNMADGSELWNTKVSRNYGWSDYVNISSSEKLVVADNLYRINFSTGETIQYPLNAGQPDIASTLGKAFATLVIAGIGTALSGGSVYFIPIIRGYDVYAGMTSNICQNDSFYYIADRYKISCVDTLLNPKWTCDFPKNAASHSELFVNGDRLYMLNMGYRLESYSVRMQHSKPFLASYDIHTGKQIYLNMLSLKNDTIQGAVATNDAFFILSDSSLVYQNVVDTTVLRQDWNVKKYGKLCKFVTDTVYAIDSIKGNFTPIYFDRTNCPVYSTNGHLYIVDKDLNIKADYPKSIIYKPYVSMKDYFCVNKGDDFWFINKLGLPVIHFNSGIRHSEFVGNKLALLTDKNDLIFIDLDKAIN